MSDKTKETPFFAQFLEDQEFPQVKTGVKAGDAVTLKRTDDDE